MSSVKSVVNSLRGIVARCFLCLGEADFEVGHLVDVSSVDGEVAVGFEGFGVVVDVGDSGFHGDGGIDGDDLSAGRPQECLFSGGDGFDDGVFVDAPAFDGDEFDELEEAFES